MPRVRLGLGLAILGLVFAACSSNVKLSADVDYRGTTCTALGREFGRYLDSEILHIQKTGEPKYLVTRRSGVPVVRDILDRVDNPTPKDEFSLLFFAPVGHLLELGEVIRDRDLPCTTEQLAKASDPEVSEAVKATLLESLRQAPPGQPETAATWLDWWRIHGGTAVSTPVTPPGTEGSAP